MFKASAFRELALRRGSVQRFIDTRCRLEDVKEIWQFFFDNPHIGLAVAKNFEMSNIAKKRKFIALMAKPTLSVIFAGFKGSGKTALAYWISEELFMGYGKKTCILYPINFTPDILPHYFYPAENEEQIEVGDYAIFDEAQLRLSSRRSNTKMNVNFSGFLTIQRHKGISLLMVQQNIKMADINEFRLADNYIFKPSGVTQLKEEMSKGNTIMKFLDFLRPLNQTETLFMSSDMQTILLFENPLPSFWSDELSTPTKNINMAEMREKIKAKASGKKTPKRETESQILAKEYGTKP